MDIGTKIKELREANDMTLEELGNKVGVGKSTVRKWETGLIANMRRDKIAKLADALHCSPGYLMGWEDSPATAPAADPLHKKIDRLDDVDKIRTEAYVDGLLSADKYQKNISAGTA